MRDIKFRRWNTLSGNMQSWDEIEAHGNFFRLFGYVDYPLMQFTGLTDRNGVDVYEGDIVEWGEGVRETVSYDKDHTMFYAETSCIDGSVMEVIGNIHQNPELLESSA